MLSPTFLVMRSPATNETINAVVNVREHGEYGVERTSYNNQSRF